MNSFYKKLGVVALSTTLASSCALFQQPSLENKLRSAYGCIGTAKANLHLLKSNQSLARSTAENSARADYQKNCLNQNIGKQQGIHVVYDPYENIAIAYKPNQ